METPTEVAGPSPLRVWSFLCTALGAALLGIGAIGSWGNVTIGLESTTRSAATPAPGIDLPEGKIALLAAVIVLIAVMAMRLVQSRSARRVWAVTIIVVALIGGGVVLETLMRSEARIGGLIVDRIASETGLPADRLEVLAKKATHVELRPAIYAALVGAVLALIGGVLGLIWVNRRPETEAVGPADQGGGSSGAQPSARGSSGDLPRAPPEAPSPGDS